MGGALEIAVPIEGVGFRVSVSARMTWRGVRVAVGTPLSATRAARSATTEAKITLSLNDLSLKAGYLDLICSCLGCFQPQQCVVIHFRLDLDGEACFRGRGSRGTNGCVRL